MFGFLYHVWLYIVPPPLSDIKIGIFFYLKSLQPLLLKVLCDILFEVRSFNVVFHSLIVYISSQYSFSFVILYSVFIRQMLKY